MKAGSVWTSVSHQQLVGSEWDEGSASQLQSPCRSEPVLAAAGGGLEGTQQWPAYLLLLCTGSLHPGSSWGRLCHQGLYHAASL